MASNAKRKNIMMMMRKKNALIDFSALELKPRCDSWLYCNHVSGTACKVLSLISILLVCGYDMILIEFCVNLIRFRLGLVPFDYIAKVHKTTD